MTKAIIISCIYNYIQNIKNCKTIADVHTILAKKEDLILYRIE